MRGEGTVPGVFAAEDVPMTGEGSIEGSPNGGRPASPGVLLVCDMDGVLIDVSRSYRDAVRRAARLFFRGARAWDRLPDPLFSLSDLAAVKQGGGLNNDWDLTHMVVTLLFSLAGTGEITESADAWTRYRRTMATCDVTELARFMETGDTPLAVLARRVGRSAGHGFVDSLYRGDVGSGNVIKQMFQEIYLGEDLFRATYGTVPEAYRGRGLIHEETPLVDRAVLEELSRVAVLAVATGRPRAEAEYPLDVHGLRTHFSHMRTLDDCLAEEARIFREEGRRVSLSKPDPFMLDAVVEACPRRPSRCYYVGDMPDDMIAAARSRAGFTGIGILSAAPDKEALAASLLAAGAIHVVESFDQVPGIVMGREGMPHAAGSPRLATS